MTKRVWVFVLAALLLGSEVVPQHTPPPLVGFSYSPLIAWQADRDPHEDLRRLLDATNADLVRLPIYWELVQPLPDAALDFSSVDSLLDDVRQYNAETGRHARVVLTGGDRISDAQMKWEVDTVHGVDPLHQVVVTTYNALNPTFDLMQRYAPPFAWAIGVGSGHPNEALTAGDAFGLDLYLDGPHIPWRDFTSIGLRTNWKQQTLAFWSDIAHADGKQMWIAEAQAQPWAGEGPFGPQDLINSAIDYRRAHVDVVLLWG